MEEHVATATEKRERSSHIHQNTEEVFSVPSSTNLYAMCVTPHGGSVAQCF